MKNLVAWHHYMQLTIFILNDYNKVLTLTLHYKWSFTFNFTNMNVRFFCELTLANKNNLTFYHFVGNLNTYCNTTIITSELFQILLSQTIGVCVHKFEEIKLHIIWIFLYHKDESKYLSEIAETLNL